jgi:RNA polymerase sigma-70 factor (ECF subfamily)
MRFYDELSQSEIAACTGIPLGTVKARMVRGLTRLREMIEVEGA